MLESEAISGLMSSLGRQNLKESCALTYLKVCVQSRKNEKKNNKNWNTIILSHFVSLELDGALAEDQDLVGGAEGYGINHYSEPLASTHFEMCFFRGRSAYGDAPCAVMSVLHTSKK